jgi:type II secretory pathway component PulF
MNLPLPGSRRVRDARLFASAASLLDAGLQPRSVFTQPGVRRALSSEASGALDRVLARGGAVADALAAAGFESVTVARVRASEMAGRLSAGLRALAAEAERAAAAIRRALSRLIYPIFVLHVAALTRGITNGLFTGNDARGLVAILELAVPVDAALALGFWCVNSAMRGGRAAGYAVKIPFARGLLLDARLLPFLRTLADLHDSGVPLDRAVALAVEDAPAFFRDPLDIAVRSVRAGEPLVPALARTGVVDETTITILQPAEISGTLTDGLTQAANVVEVRLDERVRIASRIPGSLCYGFAVLVVLWTLLHFYTLPNPPSGF